MSGLQKILQAAASAGLKTLGDMLAEQYKKGRKAGYKHGYEAAVEDMQNHLEEM